MTHNFSIKIYIVVLSFIDEIDTEPDPVENWMGKNNPKRNIKRRSRFSILNPQKVDISSNQMFILKNGFKIKIQNINTIVRNTCCFDSISQGISCIFMDNELVRNYLHQNKNCDFFNFIIQMNDKSETKQSIHTARSKVLLKLFNNSKKKRTSKDFITIDCNCNISDLMDKISTLISVKIAYRCDCNIKKTIQFMTIPLNINILFTLGVKSFEECIQLDLILRSCQICHRKACTLFEPFIMFNVQQFNIYNLKKVNIFEIPETLFINEENLKLSCVIEFRKSVFGPKRLGHYICHARRGDGIWETYDDYSPKLLKPSKRIIPHLIIYTK